MHYKKVKLGAIIFLSLGLTGLRAQETVLTSGSDASGSGGSVSCSIGQIVFMTNTGSNGSVAQGVQQPFEISEVAGIDQAKGITLQCTAYPNPSSDYVKLVIENYKTEYLTYQLYDVSGKLLETKKIEGNETSIAMCNLDRGIYFLRVTENNKEIKTLKIIKN